MSHKIFLCTLNIITLVNSVIRTNLCIDNPFLGKNYIKKEISTQEHAFSFAVSHLTGNLYVADWENKLYRIKKDKIDKELFPIGDCLVHSLAVDGLIPLLYVACQLELKVIHEITAEVQYTSQLRYSFWQLYVPKYSSDLYAVRETQEVYLYHNDKTVGKQIMDFQIPFQKRYQLAVDGNGNHYYTVRENGRDVTKILIKGMHEPLTYNAGEFRTLAVDSKRKLYGTTDKGLYRLKSDGSNAQFLTALDFTPEQMRFDMNDNILFGQSDNKIVMLKYDDACFSQLGSLG